LISLWTMPFRWVRPPLSSPSSPHRGLPDDEASKSVRRDPVKPRYVEITDDTFVEGTGRV